jgi:hypothetical protein
MEETFPQPKSKDELIQQIKDEYKALVALVESIPEEERLTPLVEQNSVKDMIAHLWDWQAYMLKRLRLTAIGETLPLRVPDGNYDRVNAGIYNAHRDRPWEDVWGDFRRDVGDVLAEIEALSEDDLFNPARGEALTGIANDRPVVDMIVGNTSEHYWEHAREIRARRGQA